jgi:polysaccharide export outer membrane protein
MDVKAPAALILAEQFALQPGDVVYVDASALATWNRVISLVLPSAGLLRTGQQINNDR